MLIVSCGECVFSVANDIPESTGSMRCRRYPPGPIKVQAVTWKWVCPGLDDGDWCGEFRPKRGGDWTWPTEQMVSVQVNIGPPVGDDPAAWSHDPDCARSKPYHPFKPYGRCGPLEKADPPECTCRLVAPTEAGLQSQVGEHMGVEIKRCSRCSSIVYGEGEKYAEPEAGQASIEPGSLLSDRAFRDEAKATYILFGHDIPPWLAHDPQCPASQPAALINYVDADGQRPPKDYESARLDPLPCTCDYGDQS